jgi:hypothetical protein
MLPDGLVDTIVGAGCSCRADPATLECLEMFISFLRRLAPLHASRQLGLLLVAKRRCKALNFKRGELCPAKLADDCGTDASRGVLR